MPRIYLDACCLNRPFDDQRQDRIRMETEAVLLILEHFDGNEWLWISSPAVVFEIGKTPSIERRNRTKAMLCSAHETVEIDEALWSRARELAQLGFRSFDSLHLACAEWGHADIFLTTDDQVCRVADRNKNDIAVRVANPLDWIKETFPDE